MHRTWAYTGWADRIKLEMAQNGQHFQKLFFPSVSAAICAGLPHFEEKIKETKKLWPKGVKVSGAPCDFSPICSL